MGHFIAHFISVQIKGQKYGQRLERAIPFNSQKKNEIIAQTLYNSKTANRHIGELFGC